MVRTEPVRESRPRLRFIAYAHAAWILIAGACGGAAHENTRAPETVNVPPRAAPAAAPEPVASDPLPSVKVKGLTGTLNKDDVHQTMDARKDALDACILESRRRLRWVSGEIRFAFTVDAAGHVADVHPVRSDIGHHVLEQCIATALANTVFPKPAGLANAEFDWGLIVDPAPGRLPDPIDVERLDKVLRKRTPDIYKKCEARRHRERFLVTAYVSRAGRVLSAGAVPTPPAAAEKLPCVLQELSDLRLPKQTHNGKVSFELR
jgi:hypothetical protein